MKLVLGGNNTKIPLKLMREAQRPLQMESSSLRLEIHRELDNCRIVSHCKQ